MSLIGLVPAAMDIKTAAWYITVDTKTIRDAIDRELLPAVRTGPKGGRWSIATADLLTWRANLGREARDD